MMPYRDMVPAAAAGKPDWQAIESAFDWFRALADCPQDPIFHAEGDVAIHTRMVVEALLADPSWQSADETGRRCLFWAALLHDVAKPERTQQEEGGRITARGHSRRGQIMARQILWRMGAPYSEREQICHLVTHHQLPFFLIERDNPGRIAHRVSYQTRCDWLTILARADANGRICPDKQRLLDNIELFAEICASERCLSEPRQFASDHSRFLYFRIDDRSADYAAYDDWSNAAAILCGLPGAGKDSWLAQKRGDAEIVSLDALRDEFDIDPRDEQGPVIAAARERARVALRAGRPLIWNATNLSRQIRGQVIDLVAAYRTKIELVYVEASEEDLLARNRQRERGVPTAVLSRMLDRWEPPDLTECHALELIGVR